MENRGEELQEVGASGEGSSAADAGPPSGESAGHAAAAAPEPQAAPATPCEAPAAAGAPAAKPQEEAAGQSRENHSTERSARDAAPAGAEDADDREGGDTPADFFGFFVDVHKGLVTELTEELQRIPASSGKICKRLGLPICAQMRAAVKPAPRKSRAERDEAVEKQ